MTHPSKSLISIVIPLYNEAERLPTRLPSYMEYLRRELPEHEIVLVNDGSRDGTRSYIDELAREDSRIKVIHIPENRGRGFGMKTGVMAASGEFILETDADLPVPPHYVSDFLNYLRERRNLEFIIGSRNMAGSDLVVRQTYLRTFAGHVFHTLFRTVFGIKARDVMCGFKLFRSDAAKRIFEHVYDERYLAAAEIVFVAHKLGYDYEELPIIWQDNRQSKVRIVQATTATLVGMTGMFWRNLCGKYHD